MRDIFLAIIPTPFDHLYPQRRVRNFSQPQNYKNPQLSSHDKMFFSQNFYKIANIYTLNKSLGSNPNLLEIDCKGRITGNISKKMSRLIKCQKPFCTFSLLLFLIMIFFKMSLMMLFRTVNLILFSYIRNFSSQMYSNIFYICKDLRGHLSQDSTNIFQP